jgi:hypothetical protein
MTLPLPRSMKTDPNFYQVVRLLRDMAPDHAVLALFGAMFWSDEKLDLAESNGDLPGGSGEVAARDLQ